MNATEFEIERLEIQIDEVAFKLDRDPTNKELTEELRKLLNKHTDMAWAGPGTIKTYF